jgi:hypothetical protein
VNVVAYSQHNKHQDKENQYRACRFDTHRHHLYLRVPKKENNVVVVATETINVARGTYNSLKKIKNGIFIAFSKTIFGFETLHVDRTQQYIHLYLFIELFETLKLYFFILKVGGKFFSSST